MAPEKIIPTQNSIPSPNGSYIATVLPGRLVIRSATTSNTIVTYRLPQDAMSRCKHICWSRLKSPTENGIEVDEDDWLGTKAEPALRILLSDDDNIRIFDPSNSSWKATITSASSNLGAIADVVFGFSYNDVLVFSDFGVKLTIWSLLTRKGAEIKDPKYNASCYSFRPRTGHLALLTRGGTQDVMMILKPGNFELLKSVELSTVDAQEVAWSVDGNWIAVRDCSSAGYRVMIYTADGQLLRIWTRDRGQDVQLGVKSMMWAKDALALGDYNDEVVFLRKDMFTPLGGFLHLPTISPQNSQHQRCWQEQISVAKERSYAETFQSVNPPDSASFAKANTPPRLGISTILFNANGSLVATRSDSWPTTVWIWSLTTGRLIAALIHHSPVKHMEWHPKIEDLLFVHCALSEPVVHIWKQSWDAPVVFSLPFQPSVATSRLAASWLQSPPSDIETANIMLSSSHHYATAQFSINDGTAVVPMAPSILEEPEAAALSMGTGPEDMFDEGHSLDFSPVKISNGAEDLGGGNEKEGFGMLGSETVDDTFFYRKKVKAGG